jgi:hypothetical protein
MNIITNNITNIIMKLTITKWKHTTNQTFFTKHSMFHSCNNLLSIIQERALRYKKIKGLQRFFVNSKEIMNCILLLVIVNSRHSSPITQLNNNCLWRWKFYPFCFSKSKNLKKNCITSLEYDLRKEFPERGKDISHVTKFVLQTLNKKKVNLNPKKYFFVQMNAE